MHRITASILLFFMAAPIALQPASAAAGIAISTVPIANAGNTNDSTGFGAVSYAYQIGTTEVTNAQYTAFLNAKAARDPFGLYNDKMGSSLFETPAGITRSGSDGSYRYASVTDREDKPVNWVSWYDSIRFANWLNNGQGSGDTETGAYTLGNLGAGGVPTSGSTIIRNPGAQWFLPSENEWYKAAYHENDGVTGDYLQYPTDSDTSPTDELPPGASNSANYNSVLSDLTDVGAYSRTTSPYGAFDMGGNVFEWNEALVGRSSRGLRGGSLDSDSSDLQSSARYSNLPFGEFYDLGFRVATVLEVAAVPEPTSLAIWLSVIGLFGAFRLRRRRLALSKVFVATFLTVAALLCSGYSMAKGAKTPPTVSRPISYVTSTSRFQISEIDVNGSSSAVVNPNATDSYPRWSPDGLFIGGYYRPGPGSDAAIMTMTPSGANEHALLTAAQFHAWNLARPGVQDSTGFDFFSSNCWLGTNAIIFTAYSTYDAAFFGQQGPPITASRLFIVDASGAISPLSELAPHAGTYDLDPHWSEALKKVVFITPTEDLKPELFAINPDGSGLQQITNFGGSVDHLHWPVWSPAGDRIVVSVHPVGKNWQLWILDVDLSQPNPGSGAGGRVTAVHPFKVVDGGGGYKQTAAWSPDGKRIIFSRTVYDIHNRRFMELVIADAASGSETLINRSSSSTIEFPDWSPVP